MIRRARHPTFPHALRETYLEALRRMRLLTIDLGALNALGLMRARKATLKDAIDGMAEELTGDRQHFHLKPHGR